MLGIAFRETLDRFVNNCNMLALTKQQLDITNRTQVLKYVNEKPDVIIHCGCKVDADFCETHKDESYKVIVKGTLNIIELARLTQAKVIYPQSFLIYDGSILPINEETKPAPLCTYGKHKLQAEKFVLKNLPDALIARMGGFFGGREKDKNFVGKIISHIASLINNKESSVEIGNRVWQPTYTDDLAFNCLMLLNEGKSGKYNMASHGQASFYELTKEIVSILGIKKRIKVISVDASRFSKKERAKRPILATIENRRLINEGLDYQRRWRDSLRDYLNHRYFKSLL